MSDHIQQAADAAERLRWLAQGAGTNITIIREGADMIDRLAANQITPEVRAVLDAAERTVDVGRDDWSLIPLIAAVDALRAATPKDGE